MLSIYVFVYVSLMWLIRQKTLIILKVNKLLYLRKSRNRSL